MQKVMLIDNSVDGHHLPYLARILSGLAKQGWLTEVVLSAPVEGVDPIILKFPKKLNGLQYLIDRRKWLQDIFTIVKRSKPDIVHFLNGDSFYQLGGWGLKNIRKKTKRLILTQHHLPQGMIRTMLFGLTIRHVDKVVIHTEAVANKLSFIGVNKYKLKVIDYPVFHSTNLLLGEARKKLGLPDSYPVLLALGGTRFDKGLDILLEALKNVQSKFVLVIAGKEEYFKREFIKEKTLSYSESVILRLGYLNDNEFGWYVDAADCVVIPYRKIFDGASGPMIEAVWRRKPVIGPSHGALGDLIKRYNFGYTFESENVDDLARVLSKYLKDPSKFVWTDKAEEYRKRLDPEIFAKKYIELYESLLG